ncbi:glycosyltransferase family 9 protein [Sneathiella sp.]|uniref:glycosyltransferase family 9 protein n=1 Tax=Sneathiella sp. TaxID=1964365 RepID=UPI002FDF9148
MKRTLFVASNRLGDAVLTTGVLHYLLETEPEAAVTVVCGTIPKSLFEDIPGVERVIGVEKRRFSLHWPEVALSLGPVFWHRIVDFRASLLGYLPARHRHIWRGGRDDVHKAVANAALIGVDRPLPPRIIPSAAALGRTENWLAGAKAGRPILALAPTANFYQKQWHHENYLALARRLTKPGGILPGARIAVFGAPGEEAQAMPVVEGLPGADVINLVGRTTPIDAAAVLSRCALFIGNDSGLMHTAVAVGIPTVALFGIGKPAVYRPWGEKSLCLESEPRGVPIIRGGNPADPDGDPLPLDRVAAECEAFYRRITAGDA